MKYAFRSFDCMTGEPVYTDELIKKGVLHELLSGRPVDGLTPLDLCVVEEQQIFVRDILMTESYPTAPGDPYCYVIVPTNYGFGALLVRKDEGEGTDSGKVHTLFDVFQNGGRVQVVGNVEQDSELIHEDDLELLKELPVLLSSKGSL